MPSLYTFTEYSPAWPEEYVAEAARVEELLGDELVAVHHVGSTSVPGLAAKSVIDLLPLVRDITRIDLLTPLLMDAGYEAWGELGLPGRRYFSRDRDGYRTHNLHFYQVDDPAVEGHLAFRDYLRRHEPTRREYEALKREAFARHGGDIAAYGAAKNPWIRRVERVALEWYRRAEAAAELEVER